MRGDDYGDGCSQSFSTLERVRTEATKKRKKRRAGRSGYVAKGTRIHPSHCCEAGLEPTSASAHIVGVSYMMRNSHDSIIDFVDMVIGSSSIGSRHREKALSNNPNLLKLSISDHYAHNGKEISYTNSRMVLF